MAVPEQIPQLVGRYRAHRRAYGSGQYKEAEVRVEFIDPLFKALGWDVHNEQGYAEAYKDVVHEDALRIGAATEAPDSCFRIGGARKFFVECKKPSVNIKDAPHPAYQLRRYGWSAKLPLSVLTDFEEFAVYDCRVKPAKGDGAAVARVLYLTWEQYAERWDEIAAIFSRDAVLRGAFDSFAEGTKGKRGTASVDDAFLEEIERWRDTLARNVAMRNPSLSQRELNFSVQRIIDRIVFLRICEDRGIEPYGRLLTLLNAERTYVRLCDLFRRADERYNSGLFHFQAEKDRPEAPDGLTLSLTVDDKVLRDILANLYYPESPYEFSVLSADILGQVYERFLGKVIRLTAGHQARVEDKPEVRKAGGVYYTPDFITKTIVRRTLSPLLEAKTPRQAAKLRICDIACGSGSFLIEAFQFLLDWHRDYYVREGAGKHAGAVYRIGGGPRGQTAAAAGGDYRLTTQEKKRILLNNIFGVDIDPQAVEVTKLSLLLKVLEGESQESIARQFELFRQRALPDLGRNIRCGNSLLGPNACENRQLVLLPDEDRRRMNVLDWDQAFPEAMKAGGFDAIVGNPPYIRIQTLKEWAPVEVDLYRTHYRTAASGNYDLYVVFVEKALRLLNRTGRLGYILPHKFLNAKYGAALRGLIAEGRYLAGMVHFGDGQVFAHATTYTCLVFLDKEGADEFPFLKVHDLDAWRRSVTDPEGVGDSPPGEFVVREAAAVYRARRSKSSGSVTEGVVSAKGIGTEEWNFAVGPGAGLIRRLARDFPQLGTVADIFVGLQTSADDVFILDHVGQTSRTLRLRSRALDSEWTLERELLHPLVSGADVSAYANLPERQYILFPYEFVEGKAVLIPFDAIERRFPRIAQYLLANKERLVARERGKFKGTDWHRFGRSQNLSIQNRRKVCVPRLVDRLCAAYDGDGSHFLDNVDVGGVTFKPGSDGHDLRYLVALLNSSLLGWFFPHVSAPFRGGWYSANRQFLSQVPFRPVDFSRVADKAEHDRLVSLVDEIMNLYRQRAAARTPPEIEMLGSQIHAARWRLDEIVFALYGVTKEDAETVRGQV